VLSGAFVRVSGSSLSSVADSAGRFIIPGVPAGDHQFEVFHPFLDTLRLALRTDVRRSTGRDSMLVIVGTPSVKTLVALKCSADDRRRGEAMAIGFVANAVTDEPVPGAQVTVEWVDYDLRNKSIVRTPQYRVVPVAPDGTYKVCGIPKDIDSGIYASRGRDTTAARVASFASGLALASFRLSPPGERAVATVAGKVVDSAGRAVVGARVSAEMETAVAVTREDGTFELDGLEHGTRAVIVRKLGFLPVTQAVEVGPVTTPLRIALDTFVPVLETVRITARRDFFLDRVGFSTRRKSSSGRFFTPDEIARRNPYRLSDLLSMVPSLRRYRTFDGKDEITARAGGCVRYFVDGARWFPGAEGPNHFISGNELGAVEVYSNLSTPGEYITTDQNGQICSAIVIWTKWKLRM
jgi:hypothetical protein